MGNKTIRYKCFLCEFSSPNKYEVRRHFNKAHTGHPYDINKVLKLSVGGEQPVATMGKRTLPRQTAEAPEDDNEEDYDYDDEDYDGDGPPPKLRRLLPYQTLDSSMLPTPDTPAASQDLLVNEPSETFNEHQQATPVAPEYDPRLILSKEASNDPNFVPELHIEIQKAIARTKEFTEQTAVSTIASLKADVEARDRTIEFLLERLRKQETWQTLN